MVNTRTHHRERGGSGAHYWLLTLVGLPWAALVVALVFTLQIGNEDGPLLPLAGWTGVAAALLLQLLPALRSRSLRDRLVAGVVGGVATVIASAGWLFGFVIASMVIACRVMGHCLT
jgi:hypothetical protein